MDAMSRESWTDARLDDLATRVDRGFESVDRRFDGVQREFVALRSEVGAEFAAVRAEVRAEFAAVRAEVGEVRTEVTATQRLLVQLFVPLIVTLIFGFAGMIVTLMIRL